MQQVDKKKKKKVLVVGFGISGINVAQLLVKLGAQVTANDQKDDQKTAEKLQQMGVKTIVGSNPLSLADENFDLVVKNPGIPYDNPLIARFVQQQTPIITEVEVASEIFAGHLIGVTGSNGKTTTTTLIAKMIKQAHGGEVHYAGNIGVPFSKVAEQSGDQ